MPPRRRPTGGSEDQSNIEEEEVLNNNNGNGDNQGQNPGGNPLLVDPLVNQPRLPSMGEFLDVTRDYGPQLCTIEGDNYQILSQLINLLQQGAIF